MGWGERANARNGFPKILATRLTSLRAVVDVQHLYRTGRHAGDRGSLYALKDGTHIAETDATTLYGTALTAWLRARGATVLTNDPSADVLIGPYSFRNRAAMLWRADCYLACHLNAGGGSYAALEYAAGRPGDRLAANIAAQIAHDFRTTINTARTVPITDNQRGAVCIRGFTGAAVILEPFFGDNPRQQALFASTTLHQLGETIGEGVAQWWERRAVVRAV